MSDQDWCPLGDRGTKLELHEARVDSDKWVEIYRVRRGGWNVAVHNGSLTGDLVARGTGRGRAFRVGLEEYVRLTEGVEYGMREPVRKRSRSLRAVSAADYVDPGGQGRAHHKIPHGSILRLPNGKRMIVERSNGYVISGYEENHINRRQGIDLRIEDADLVQKEAKAMGTLGQKAFREGKATMDALKADCGE